MNYMKTAIFLLTIVAFTVKVSACTIFYYKDVKNGKLYFVNNEDYWYDVKPYIQIIPASKKSSGRVWYGWNNFGQGGVNEKGLVIDGAATPIETIPAGYKTPHKDNITDEILATCATVDDAVRYLDTKKIALNNAHIFFGDKNGKAVIVEWVNGLQQVVDIKNNRLVATNFNISKIPQSQITCWRYLAIEKGLDELDASNDTINLKSVGIVMAKAAQLPQKDSTGKTGGTLYSTFIDLSEMQLVLVYKLDNSKIQKIDIINELKKGKKRKIRLP